MKTYRIRIYKNDDVISEVYIKSESRVLAINDFMHSLFALNLCEYDEAWICGVDQFGFQYTSNKRFYKRSEKQ